MKRTITLDNGDEICTLCNARGHERVPLVHVTWCDGLHAAMKRSRQYALWSSAAMGISMGALISMGIWVTHNDEAYENAVETAKHELQQHLQSLQPTSMYYDFQKGKIKVLSPDRPHQDEGPDHAERKTQGETQSEAENG